MYYEDGDSELDLENELEILWEIKGIKNEARIEYEKRIQKRELIFSILKKRRTDIINNLQSRFNLSNIIKSTNSPTQSKVLITDFNQRLKNQFNVKLRKMEIANKKKMTIDLNA